MSAVTDLCRFTSAIQGCQLLRFAGAVWLAADEPGRKGRKGYVKVCLGTGEQQPCSGIAQNGNFHVERTPASEAEGRYRFRILSPHQPTLPPTPTPTHCSLPSSH
eukprot:1144307-Pelagomonas_calceolata.AAC.4